MNNCLVIYIMNKRAESFIGQRDMQALTNAVANIAEDHYRLARTLTVWQNGKAV